MRGLIGVMVVAVMASTVVGCAQKKEEIPPVDMSQMQAPAPAPEEGAVQVETPGATVPTVTGETTTGGQTYTMQRGDTLYSLAKRFYGDGKLWTRIADANRDKFRDEKSIPVGTVLVIPPQ